jgi:two-component system response regulator AtoC
MKSLDVMVIDDEPVIRQMLAAHLHKAGCNVVQAGDGEQAFERLSKGDIEVAICDIKMPGISGIELVRQARAAGIDTSFIMMTAFASVDTAIEAMQAGATDYIVKPVRNEELQHRLLKIKDMRGLRAENRVLRSLVQGRREDQFEFNSPAMRELGRLVDKVSPTASTVLVTGESGTGKGVVARRIHQQSPRANAPFIPVNCGALPDNLIESELFGHIKGAFTGADKARKGLFLEADGGTLFLDEIGELPLMMQVKLLHVIEEKSIRAVGSEQARRADVRIIAATNRDLAAMVAEGRFREDLYFRLSVFQIPLPPLRERRADLLPLIAFLLRRGAERMDLGRIPALEPEVEELLLAYQWPGNVRELEHVIDRALILADSGQVSCADLPPQIVKDATPALAALPLDGAGGDASAWQAAPGDSLRDQVRRFECTAIARAIREADGDRRLAAQKLGMGLSSLYRKQEEFETLGLL